MVDSPTSKVCWTCSSDQAGPASLLSAFNKICACMNLLAGATPLLKRCFKACRCSSVNRTIYFFIRSLLAGIVRFCNFLKDTPLLLQASHEGGQSTRFLGSR